MTQNSFCEDQVTQIRGFADQRVGKRDAPVDPLNLAHLADRAISGETGWSGHRRRRTRYAEEGIELSQARRLGAERRSFPSSG
jgi:hypothetical protein